MPRKARIDAPGALHHIMARGIEGCSIFSDDADCEDFLERLANIVVESRTTCYAWSLVGNHFHLLLKTGNVSIASVMRRLLTGYASCFNRRHERRGHVFQNRYKSILCQEDVYLKDLIRYIHLNPLRAGFVKDLEALETYPYAGHGAVMGRHKCTWQAVDAVLSLFDPWVSVAREGYEKYVAEGIEAGRREDLAGGGLIRSAGGWTAVKSSRKQGKALKSDERILGDPEFVAGALAKANEAMERKSVLSYRGVDLNQLIQLAASLVSIPPEEVVGFGKARNQVKARRLVCYWGANELGLTMTELAAALGISVPTASVAAKSGKRIVAENRYSLPDLLNIKI